MNLAERIAQRRETHQQFQAMGATTKPRQQEAHEQERFPGQFISGDRLAKEREYEKQFSAFKGANGRYPVGDELDLWTKQQQQKLQVKPLGYNQDWEIAMQREVAAPILKNNKPIQVPDPKAAVSRVTEQRQEQVKLDQSLDGKTRKLSM